MTKETSEKTEKQGRVVQVTAAAMAAITAALLGSTLGVAGTVAGAGLASVITTLGGELYLRSLQRTKDAALKARMVLTVPGRRQVLDPADQETVRLTPLDGDEASGSSERKFKPRWAVIAGVSVVAFVVALVAITGFEGATGKTFGGGEGTTIGKIIGGGQAQERQDKRDTPPATSPSETREKQPDSTPTTTPSTPATPTTPTTTPSTTPSTTPPSTSQAPPTTHSAPASGTPAP
ncbi:hypothetical protein [Amycolatopsis sp. NPDC051071]|uniref:hypothetical protein n=1 Tax=Amycolatopsis sp. NPDC051071 TaxID=3154637 RepID=UPI003436208F